jgi:hypothetical protein
MNDETATILMKKAELLMELRDYNVEKLQKSKAKIDITASKPDSEKTVLMRIIPKSKFTKDAIGVDHVRRMKTSIEKNDFDKVIVFGNRFTSAAQKELRDEDIEFFSTKLKIVSTLDIQEVYAKVIRCADELCKSRCGHIPQSEAECKGYSDAPTQCAFCGGSGRKQGRQCPVCFGTGLGETHYSCIVRLISDNADFHFEHGWVRLLQNDLYAILELLSAANSKQPGTETTFEGDGKVAR